MLICICINSHAEPCELLLSNYMYMAIYADLVLTSALLVIWNATNYTLYIISNIIVNCTVVIPHMRTLHKEQVLYILLYFSHMYIGTFINTALQFFLWTAWCSCSGFTGYNTAGSSICFLNVGTGLQPATWYITKMDFHHLQKPQNVLNELSYLKICVKDFLSFKENVLWYKKLWYFLLWNAVVAMFIVFSTVHCVPSLAHCSDETHLLSHERIFKLAQTQYKCINPLCWQIVIIQ
jgi:hypothetical protein